MKLSEINEFNRFVEYVELFDIPFIGRKFTWYKNNGVSKSRIYRYTTISQTYA